MNRVRFCTRKLPSIQLHVGALSGNSAIFDFRFFRCKCFKYSKHLALIQNKENAFTGIFHFHLMKGTILNKQIYFLNYLKKCYKQIILKHISQPAAQKQSHSPLKTRKKAFFLLSKTYSLILKMYAHDGNSHFIISANKENLVKLIRPSVLHRTCTVEVQFAA